MANTAQADIRALVDNFVEQLTQQIRISALESVRDALLDGKAPAAPARRGRKPGPKPGPKPGKKAAKKPGKRGKRGRRTPEQIEADKANILSYVKSNPGTAMGDLTKALGMDAITIRAQVNDLLDAGALSKEGERRGTRYFAGGGSKTKTTRGKKAAGRKKAVGRKAAKRGSRKKTARK